MRNQIQQEEKQINNNTFWTNIGYSEEYMQTLPNGNVDTTAHTKQQKY